MMDKGAFAIFETKYKYSRAFWIGVSAFQVFLIIFILAVRPAVFDLTFSSRFLDDNKVFVIITALISILALWGLRRKNEFASYALNLRDSEKLVIGYLYSPCIALSITCWGTMLALYFEYPYSFLWFAMGLLGALYVFPRRAEYEQIFRKVNTGYISP